MSTLRSAVDELRTEVLRFLGDDELHGDLDEIERTSRVLEAERSRRLREVERRTSFTASGAVSIVAWLADRSGISRGASLSQVRLARALHHAGDGEGPR